MVTDFSVVSAYFAQVCSLSHLSFRLLTFRDRLSHLAYQNANNDRKIKTCFFFTKFRRSKDFRNPRVSADSTLVWYQTAVCLCCSLVFVYSCLVHVLLRVPWSWELDLSYPWEPTLSSTTSLINILYWPSKMRKYCEFRSMSDPLPLKHYAHVSWRMYILLPTLVKVGEDAFSRIRLCRRW